jgi:hypothetical protein
MWLYFAALSNEDNTSFHLLHISEESMGIHASHQINLSTAITGLQERRESLGVPFHLKSDHAIADFIYSDKAGPIRPLLRIYLPTFGSQCTISTKGNPTTRQNREPAF